MFSSLKTEFTNRLSLTDANQILILGDFLDSLDLYLTGLGVVFSSSNTTKTIKLYNRQGKSKCKTLFTFPEWLQTSGAVLKIVNKDLTEKVLILDEDYAFWTARNTPKPAFMVELLNQSIWADQYLSITGIWKFGETLPVDLKLAGLQLASQFLAKSNQNLTSQSGFVKSSVSIDKVSYGLKTAEIKSSFQDKDFQNVLSAYNLCSTFY